MKVQVTGFDNESDWRGIIEAGLAKSDDRGYNVKHFAESIDLGTDPHTPAGKLKAARAARSLGFKVRRKKYPRGTGYIIFADDAYRDGRKED